MINANIDWPFIGIDQRWLMCDYWDELEEFIHWLMLSCVTWPSGLGNHFIGVVLGIGLQCFSPDWLYFSFHWPISLFSTVLSLDYCRLPPSGLGIDLEWFNPALLPLVVWTNLYPLMSCHQIWEQISIERLRDVSWVFQAHMSNSCCFESTTVFFIVSSLA